MLVSGSILLQYKTNIETDLDGLRVWRLRLRSSVE